jgi:Uracil DNA glycosylase superfamily
MDDPINQLKDWADVHIGNNAEFKCLYYAACNKSINHELGKGEGCCMGYIGRDYGRGFKLVFVGIDHGEFDPFSGLQENRQWIEENYIGRPMEFRFNQHYVGVVRHSAMLLGHPACQCQRECCSTSHPSVSSCVLKKIAQLNIVKCVPKTQANRTARSNQTMKENCANHLVRELRILRPNLIVFHGVGSRRVVIPAFERSGIDLTAINECSDRHGAVLYDSNELGAHILFLFHPSHGWLKRQWPQFETWISYLRSQRLIPT